MKEFLWNIISSMKEIVSEEKEIFWNEFVLDEEF